MRYIFAAMFFFACLSTFARAADLEPIKIGWSGPLTANAAVLGIDSVVAAQMAIEEANAEGGKNSLKFELIVEDDQYDTNKAVTAYTKLASQGVIAIIASTYGGVFATANRALNDKVIVINPLDCNNEIAALPENTFCIATESESIGRVISEDIRKKFFNPVAVIYDLKNPFMDVVQRVIRDAYALNSGSYFTGVDESATDFKTDLLRIRSKAAKALVFLGHDPMGRAMQEARALGIKAQFYTLGTITSPGYQKLAGAAANGTLVAYWNAPESKLRKQFIERFSAKVGRQPILELATIPTYDSVKILVSTIREVASRSTRVDVELLKKKLYAVKNYPGVSGTISMDADGAVRTIREELYTFLDGELKKQ